jgi:hypothetical protein
MRRRLPSANAKAVNDVAHKTNAELVNHIAAGKSVMVNGVSYTDAAKLPTDAQMDATAAAIIAARVADIDAQVAVLTARRVIVAAGGA